MPKAVESTEKADLDKTDLAKEQQVPAETIFIMPGDFVGTSEEFTAGSGTYVSGGNIHSLVTGTVSINKKGRVVSVVPTTSTPPVITEGDIVVGGVVNVRESIVLVELAALKGAGERDIRQSGLAAIHVSNVSKSYVKDLSREFVSLDIVKAKVINIQNMRLSTAEESLGVMKAICSNCRDVLVKEDNKLICPSCGRKESRKLSSDYGTGII